MNSSTSVALEALLGRHAPVSPVALCPELRAHQAADVYALWQAWEELNGRKQNVPFWATVWPAASVLARYVLDHPSEVAGKRVLEIGCGGGVAAVAAAKAGAVRVIANDTDPVALAVTARNAVANDVVIETLAGDLAAGALPPVDLLVAADLLYEKHSAERAVHVLDRAASAGMRVLVADAGRPFADMVRLKKLWETDIAVDEHVEGVPRRHVTVGQMRPLREQP